MKDLLNALIGTYQPVQVTDNLYIDIPYTICGILIIVFIAVIIKGVFNFCKR